MIHSKIKPLSIELPVLNSASNMSLELWPNPKQSCLKRPMTFTSVCGRTGFSEDIFLKFTLGSFDVIKVSPKFLLNVQYTYSANRLLNKLENKLENV